MTAVDLLLGDCIERMREMDASSIDAIVCDPPYELGFMAKSWDSAGVSFQPATWAECLRVLKPGGHLLAFGGTRTVHRIAVAIEDAGFEIRDTLAWMYGCLTPDAEVLTESGWKPGIEVEAGEKIATWDPADESVRLAPVERTYRAAWRGPLRVLRNDDTDQLVTPNHRVYHQTMRRKMTDGVRRSWWPDGWEVSEAASVTRYCPTRLPLGGYADGPGVGGTRYARLLGLVWTEGSFDRSGTGVRIYQSASANPDAVREIDQLLCRVAPRHRRYDRERVYSSRVSGNVLSAETTWFFSGEFAERVRADLPGKIPTYELLWRMTLAEKGAFLEAAFLGDGSGSQFEQKGREPLEWLQTLCHLIGWSGRVTMRSNRDTGAMTLRRSGTTELQSRHFKAAPDEYYEGDVWCVGVPTGAFLVRRSGRIFVTGNSGFPKSLDVSKAIDKAAGAEREVVGTSRRCVGPSQEEGYLGTGTFRGGTNDLTVPATPEAELWQGWGTALKPAFEPVVMARKPLGGTIDVRAYLESRLRTEGVEGEIRWTRPVSAAGRRSRSRTSGSTEAPVTEETSAGNVNGSETPTIANETDPPIEQQADAGGHGTPSTPVTRIAEESASFAPPLSPRTARPAAAAASRERSSSRSTTSPEAEQPIADRFTGRSTPNSAAKDSLLGTESSAGTATGRFGSLVRVPIRKNEDGSFEWPDGLPELIAIPSTVAANVVAHGTGALNIDDSRIGYVSTDDQDGARPGGRATGKPGALAGGTQNDAERQEFEVDNSKGRWPANVILDEEAGALLDEQTGDRGGGYATRGESLDEHIFGFGNDRGDDPRGFGDSGGASRFFYQAKVSRAERNAGLDGFEPSPLNWSSGEQSPGTFQSDGTDKTARNHHPTVKPIALMRWLIRLVTPPGGTVLDPFLGSGSTGCAAVLEGFSFVGIEREPDYLAIAAARIGFWQEHGEDALDVVRVRAQSEARHREIADAGQLDLLSEPT